MIDNHRHENRDSLWHKILKQSNFNFNTTSIVQTVSKLTLSFCWARFICGMSIHDKYVDFQGFRIEYGMECAWRRVERWLVQLQWDYCGLSECVCLSFCLAVTSDQSASITALPFVDIGFSHNVLFFFCSCWTSRKSKCVYERMIVVSLTCMFPCSLFIIQRFDSLISLNRIC